MKLGKLSLLLFSLFLTGCQTESKSTTKEVTTVTEQTTTEQELVVDYSLYDSVKEAYLSAIDTKTLTPELNSLLLMYGPDMVYTRYDFDNNGIEELVLAVNNYGSTRFMDLYTISKNNELVPLTDEDSYLMTIGERSTLIPIKDGKFAFHASSGAFSGVDAVYEFNETGTSLVKVKEFTYQNGETSIYTDKETGETYSREEVQPHLGSQETLDIANWEWKPLAE